MKVTKSCNNKIKRCGIIIAAAVFVCSGLNICGWHELKSYAAESSRTIGYDVTKVEKNKKDEAVVSAAETEEESEIRTPKYIPISTEKTDRDSYFGGGSLTMLSNKDNDAQNMSFIFDTGDGLIVVDGGWDTNGESLLKELKARGGNVKAWLITHPHRDHAYALAYILNNHANEVNIENIYYSFFDRDWYVKNDDESVMIYDALMSGFAKLQQERIHGDIKAGDVIEVGKAKIQVLNNAYDIKANSGNNSSVCYMISMNGCNVVFLGDMGVAAGNLMAEDVDLRALKCDIVQVAHHGQEGVSYNFYSQLAPKVMMWPTPAWLWYNDTGNGRDSGPYSIAQTKSWQHGLVVKEYYVAKDGDHTVY